MVSIYALMSGELVLYVGKSKRVKMREWQHRKGQSHCSKQIPDYTEWVFKVLEETTEALGTEREQYFYDTLKPLYNKFRPGQTQKEYKQTEGSKASRKAYKQTDDGKASQKAYSKTEAWKAYQRKYYETHKKLISNPTPDGTPATGPYRLL